MIEQLRGDPLTINAGVFVGLRFEVKGRVRPKPSDRSRGDGRLLVRGTIRTDRRLAVPKQPHGVEQPELVNPKARDVNL
jgi:hypothetical protein